jgi:hypothetical protein
MFEFANTRTDKIYCPRCQLAQPSQFVGASQEASGRSGEDDEQSGSAEHQD